ncbi:3-dehydrosphinganine reductase KNAG_0C01750 [Huiozyma naganishii CBS 8797]|uniref:3-ketodihydrosphingosine reductase TSC10 n=1 Tax=Huiozyma naganishii (strain ATCC MYA-139 / BCRC 22969 / CBS 8797 / KCTC 17520 / NBRC 10181 / NCYC 3082 / Yp74L-3) TaxID=1071383 RepID=J7S4G8_HUIN7|nr:hypothetical protein KNAG_0C01750 [Kazachstania naganishii CBS 8797]CCK69289.1 hypothetical protein KNAG_0C01750 [Kazachstania naganishii CBS 8797]
MSCDGRYTLEGQVVLLAGASQGLGRQFAAKYFRETRETRVVLVSRSAPKLLAAIEEITGGDGAESVVCLNGELPAVVPPQARLMYYACDLGDASAVEELFCTLKRAQLVPTQVLSCVGGSVPKLFRDLTLAELDLGVRMNYMSALFLSHAALRLGTPCHLILFSSVTAFFPFIGYSQYAPAKVAIKSLVGIIRQECPPGSLMRISCVYPGNFQSEGFILEELTKPEITRQLEGPSAAIPCELCCDKIVSWLSLGYDDITTDAIGWVLMSLDMGLNKHYNNSFLWLLQLLLGAVTNLIVVPLYMVYCNWEIRRYFKAKPWGASTLPLLPTEGADGANGDSEE